MTRVGAKKPVVLLMIPFYLTDFPSLKDELKNVVVYLQPSSIQSVEILHLKACCGSRSGSAFIWLFLIRVLTGKCGSGFSSMKIYQNLHINLVSSLSKRPLYPRRYVFWPYTILFHEKIQRFFYFKVWLRPGTGSAWIRIVSVSWIPIQIRIEIKSWIWIPIENNV